MTTATADHCAGHKETSVRFLELVVSESQPAYKEWYRQVFGQNVWHSLAKYFVGYLFKL